MTAPAPGIVLFGPEGTLISRSAELAALPPDALAIGRSLDEVKAGLAGQAGLTMSEVALENGGICLVLLPGDAALKDDSKSRFLATMSHELRTPLNVVIGFADALLREAREPTPPPQARLSEFAGSIHQAGQELLGLINTILDVARIEQGRFALQGDTIDIAHIVDSCVSGMLVPARKAGVTVTASVSTGAVRLRADERRLRQVLQQLLANALTFTGAGGSVMLAAGLTDQGALQLSVRDTGIGIDPAQLAHVFEPFSQADGGLARRVPGAGLGLYVCRALIQAHGGTLDLESRPGAGTTATITLPASRLIEPSPSLLLFQDMS